MIIGAVMNGIAVLQGNSSVMMTSYACRPRRTSTSA